MLPRARDARRTAAAITVWRCTKDGGAGIDGSARGRCRHERQRRRPGPLPNQGDKAADVGGGIGTAIDEKPSSPRLSGWNIPTGGSVNWAVQASQHAG